MDLYLIRHADAVPVGQRGVTDDGERPLTEEGLERARALGETFRRRGVRLDRIVASPLVRARQTAEQLASAVGEPAPALDVCGELAPGGKPRKLTRAMREYSGDAIALVGHEPDLGRYAGWLMGSKKVHLEMAKAGVAVVRFAGKPGKGDGTLIGLLPPEWWTGERMAGAD